MNEPAPFTSQGSVMRTCLATAALCHCSAGIRERSAPPPWRACCLRGTWTATAINMQLQIYIKRTSFKFEHTHQNPPREANACPHRELKEGWAEQRRTISLHLTVCHLSLPCKCQSRQRKRLNGLLQKLIYPLLPQAFTCFLYYETFTLSTLSQDESLFSIFKPFSRSPSKPRPQHWKTSLCATPLLLGATMGWRDTSGPFEH